MPFAAENVFLREGSVLPVKEIKISVVVPVYNLEKELPRCLDSILAQTYGNIEVIAVDDGSSDGSRKVLEMYAARDSRVKPVFKENGGVTSARLRGMAEAVGEWIGFVDGDDEIESDMYQRLLDNAQKYDAQISHCGYQMVFADGRVNFFHNSGRLRVQDCSMGVRDLLEGTLVEPGLCNKLFRREVFRGWEMDETIRINEDLLMNYYLFSNAEVSVFDDWCPYHYIVRGSSASRAKLNHHKIYDPIRVKEIIRQAAPADIRQDALRAYVNTCINIYHTLLTAQIPLREDLRKVRDLLKRETEVFHLLGRKRALMAHMIVRAPLIYKPVYRFYGRFLQQDPYS